MCWLLWWYGQIYSFLKTNEWVALWVEGLALVAIVIGGLTFAFGEGGSKRVLAGVLFGVGMAIAAVNFLAWLFPA